MEGQTVYATYDILNEVFLSTDNESHNLLSKIISDYSDVVVDLSDEEFEKSFKENPFIKALLKRPHKKTIPLKDFFDNIEDEGLSNYPRDIFLLDQNDQFCKDSMKKYGVLILNSNSINHIKNLSIRYSKDYEKNEDVTIKKGNQTFSGWIVFLEKVKFNIAPLNSMVIIDNFLFNHLESGKRNLLDLILSLLPKELDCTFHILIIIDNRKAKFNDKKLEEIKNDIQTELQLKQKYKIEVGIMSHGVDEKLHARLLITNYHFIRSEYGVDVFNNGKVKKDNHQELLGVYHTLSIEGGDTEIKTVCRKLKYIKEKLTAVKNLNQSTDIIVGECDNRLLRDF